MATGPPPPSQITAAHARALPGELAVLVPQGGAAWLALRQGCLTASNVAAFLGFQEPDAAKVLGMSSAWQSAGKGAAMRQQLLMPQQAGSSSSSSSSTGTNAGPQLQWGLQHEANGRKLLISTRTWHKQLPAFHGVTSVRLQEQGFHQLSQQHLAALGSHLPEGFSLQQLPPMGASPDDVLLAEGPTGLKRYAVEYKATFPFVLAKQGKENTAMQLYEYVPGKHRPKVLLPLHYAQMQLQMLVLGVDSCLYVSYGVNKSVVTLIPFCPEWCGEMLTWVGHFWANPAAPSSDAKAKEAYASFLKLTGSKCADLPSGIEVPSVRAGSEAPFC